MLLLVISGQGDSLPSFSIGDGLRKVEVSAGGMYGHNEYGGYGQGYVSGEVGVGPGFFPVMAGAKVGGPWVSGQQPYEFWVGICGECYQKWLNQYTERLLGGEALINRYKMLSREMGRLDSLLSLVDTSALRFEMDSRLSMGDTMGFDSLRRLYEGYKLMYRRYAYVKGMLDRIPIDTSLLNVRGDIMGMGSVLRMRGKLPKITTYVERVRMLKVGRFQPSLMPPALMYPMWLEGLENLIGVSEGLNLGFFGGRISTLPYGIDSVRRYWSGGLRLDIKGRYRLGGYGIISDKERQYVGYVGIYGKISRFVYDINVFRAMYERQGPSYILVRDGVEDSVSGRWRSSHSGFWGSAGYGSKMVSVALSGSYYGRGRLLLLPNLPSLVGTWKLTVKVKGRVWRPSFEVGQIFLPAGMKYRIGVRTDVNSGSIRAMAMYRSYVRGIGQPGTHILMFKVLYSGPVSPSVFVRYQYHEGSLDVWSGGMGISFNTGRISHGLNGSYQILRWLVPVEWQPVQRQYEVRYNALVRISSVGIGPYVWYYLSEGGIGGRRSHLVGGLQFSYSTSWGMVVGMWAGAGPYFTESSRIVRFDSGIQIGWQWER